jgi:hypothetical protein
MATRSAESAPELGQEPVEGQHLDTPLGSPCRIATIQRPAGCQRNRGRTSSAKSRIERTTSA